MPLHRNESSQQKTITFKCEDTLVRENHNLSRERVTEFTQVSSASTINLKPEFVFKGKGGCEQKLPLILSITSGPEVALIDWNIF